jgi:hypothetical protein
MLRRFMDADFSSQILAIGLAVTVGQQARNGMGMHISELSEKQMIDSQKVRIVLIYILKTTLIRPTGVLGQRVPV